MACKDTPNWYDIAPEVNAANLTHTHTHTHVTDSDIFRSPLQKPTNEEASCMFHSRRNKRGSICIVIDRTCRMQLAMIHSLFFRYKSIIYPWHRRILRNGSIAPSTKSIGYYLWVSPQSIMEVSDCRQPHTYTCHRFWPFFLQQEALGLSQVSTKVP